MTDADNPAVRPHVRVVLVGTTHAGNIGASARAMKTMGLRELALVQPRGFPSAEATARAAGADDVLAGARVHDTLAEAVADCVLVLGTSARDRRLQWPLLSPREAAERAAEAMPRGTVALVFGRERSGLQNEELDLCHALIRIPTASDYASLNLAAAVQVLSYELRLALPSSPTPAAAATDDAVSQGEMEGFYAHLRDVLEEVGYRDPKAPKLLDRRLRRMFNRMHPDRPELNILRGILSAIQHKQR